MKNRFHFVVETNGQTLPFYVTPHTTYAAKVMVKAPALPLLGWLQGALELPTEPKPFRGSNTCMLEVERQVLVTKLPTLAEKALSGSLPVCELGADEEEGEDEEDLDEVFEEDEEESEAAGEEEGSDEA